VMWCVPQNVPYKYSNWERYRCLSNAIQADLSVSSAPRFDFDWRGIINECSS
jgi:hypothetical protein